MNGNVNTHCRSPLSGGSTRSIRSAAVAFIRRAMHDGLGRGGLSLRREDARTAVEKSVMGEREIGDPSFDEEFFVRGELSLADREEGRRSLAAGSDQARGFPSTAGQTGIAREDRGEA